MEKTNSQHFWLGLEDYQRDPEFMKMAENEFLSSPLKEGDAPDGVARREFLKLMGASLAMASTACIRRPVQKIIPYAQSPKYITPGEPNFFASTWFDGQEGCGVLVKTLEGRPLKLEGNPRHPMNRGGLPARAHAEVLALYDPDRLRAPTRNLFNKTRSNSESVSSTFADVDTLISTGLEKGKVAILTGSLPSPSALAMISDFLRVYPGAHTQWDALSPEATREANLRCYGKASVPRLRLDRSRFIVSIDCDFLGSYLATADQMRQWSQVRKPGGEMTRLVAFESALSLTGMNADDRFRIRSSQQLDVVLALLKTVGAKLGSSGAFAKIQVNPSSLGLPEGVLEKVAAELINNKGQSLVVAGSLTCESAHAVNVQIAVNWLNQILGNDGKTVDHENSLLAYQSSATDLAKLIAQMTNGEIKTLIISGTNPMQNLPDTAGFRAAVSKVDQVIYFGNYNDETGKLANFILPAGSALEAWGDFELMPGVYSVQQPTIAPLYQTRSLTDSLIAWASKNKSAPARLHVASTYEYVRNFWKSDIFAKAGKGASFEDFWVDLLQFGVFDSKAEAREKTGSGRSIKAEVLNSALASMPVSSSYELSLYPKIGIGDGRYANVPWLQELPDPVTKIVWDNYLLISPEAAKKESLKHGDMVNLTVGDQSLELPVALQPGMHDAQLAMAVGYGRENSGKVATGLGVSARPMWQWKEGRRAGSALAAKLEKTGIHYSLVSTQSHHQLRDPKWEAKDRPIVFETTLSAWKKDPASGIENSKVFSIWPEHKYTAHRWAMSIDLNTCTGCSACVIACQSENNVPVVGKKYVMQGREMHWIRIDRYYKGNPSEPEAIFQPMLCQHCENAPCETVCPVLATVHNDEGLNDMIYNRCVGTRYCSNNCPYKVRRFNWFNYSKRPEPTYMALNPDVTVRSRGVMEKCTFCVHKIRVETNKARDKGERVKDGAITPACAESCPTQAIVFGDLNDPGSQVAKIFQQPRAFAVLEDLNTKPRIRYMSRVRNAERAQEESEPKVQKEGGA